MVRAHAPSMCRSFVVFAFVASCTLNIAASATQEEVVQVPNNVDERTKELEAEMAPLASDMWATQRRLERKGYRVDSGNKSPTGWWLTANNKNISPGSIRVQSDGTKIVVTVEK
jgi:allophanate hydrolase subunit 2